MPDFTVAKALEWAKGLLSAETFSSGSLDSELLLCHAANLRRVDLYINPDARLSAQEIDIFMTYVMRRAKSEPVAYITGSKEFYGLSFKVGPGVLIPRPETELLVEKAIEAAPFNSTVFEIGTGSGAVIISILASRNDLKGIASDISEEAIAIARQNTYRHNMHDRLILETADGTDTVTGTFPVIVMNPPYVARKDIHELAPDVVNFEPDCALFGGEDGLEVIRKVLRNINEKLSPGGVLIMETGYNQLEEINNICLKNRNIKVKQWINDLSGLPRVVIIENQPD